MPRRKRGGALAKSLIKALPAIHAMMKEGGRKRRRRVRRRGAGFFGDLWSGVKSVGSHILPVANDLLKQTKIISNLAPGIVGKAAGALGYGRRRRVRRRKRGGLAEMKLPGRKIYMSARGRKRGGALHCGSTLSY
jgi:hypothetical protein